MPTRKEVYEVIDAERDYQDNLPPDRTDSCDHTVGDYLVMLDTYFRRAKDGWTDTAGCKEALINIRKCAAICVRAMEEHGAIKRDPSPRSSAD